VTAQDTIGEVVRLSVPAALEYVRIVRLTASGVASRLGLDVDEIENLRVAVDELASTVVDASADGDLEISFSSGDGELRIEGRAPVASGGDVGIDQLSAQILNAVCDKYELRVVDGAARFSCTHRLPSD
jgi:serine/threonine-protein kinase RsbW